MTAAVALYIISDAVSEIYIRPYLWPSISSISFHSYHLISPWPQFRTYFHISTIDFQKKDPQLRHHSSAQVSSSQLHILPIAVSIAFPHTSPNIPPKIPTPHRTSHKPSLTLLFPTPSQSFSLKQTKNLFSGKTTSQPVSKHVPPYLPPLVHSTGRCSVNRAHHSTNSLIKPEEVRPL